MRAAKLIFAFSTLLNIFAYSEECGNGQKPMRAGIRHIEGNGIGYNKGYSTAELFLSPNWEKAKPFLDLRGHVFNNGNWATNLGLGYRHLTSNRVYGGNVYYDWRETSRKNYNQIGLGLETLGKRWDFRINGYIPVGTRKTEWYNKQFDGFCGNCLFVKAKEQFSMGGAHAEAGVHLNKLIKYKQLNNVDFYSALGPYYFQGQGRHAVGGQFRIKGKYKEYFSLEASVSYDNVFKDIYQGQVAFSIPFGPSPKLKTGRAKIDNCSTLLVLDERMMDPVVRDEIIVVDSRHKSFAGPCNFLFVNNTSLNSLGTFEAPFATLKEAESSSTPGDIIFVFPGDGTSKGMDAGFIMKDGQRVLSSAVSHSFDSCLGCITVPCFCPNQPLIVNNDPTASNVIQLANNSEFSGFDVESFATVAIPLIVNVNPISNVNINNNYLASTDDAILLSNVGGIVNINCNTFKTFDDSISITLNKIQNSHFFLGNNNGQTQLHAFNIDLTDCANVTFDISKNKFTTNNISLQYNIANSTDGPVNPLNINNNELTSTNAGIFITNANPPNTHFHNLDVTLNQNIISAFFAGVQINQTNATSNVTFRENNILRGDISVFLNYTDAIVDTSLTNNLFNTQNNINLAITIFGPTSKTSWNIVNNEFFSHTQGIRMTDAGSLTNNFVIANNFFSTFSEGLFIQNTAMANEVLDIQNNTFKGTVFSPSVTINQTGTGSTCLKLNNNTASPREFSETAGAYNLSELGGGVFNLEPPICNIGRITKNGLINDVPAGTCVISE